MPSSNTLPLGKTPAAPDKPADFSRAGLILPIVTDSPSDSMFEDGMAQDGMMMIEHRTGDQGGLLWVRVDGTWTVFASV